MPRTSNAPHSDTLLSNNERRCKWCNEVKKARGMRSHETACRRRHETQHEVGWGEGVLHYEQDLHADQESDTAALLATEAVGSQLPAAMDGLPVSDVQDSDAVADATMPESFFIEIVPYPTSGQKPTIIPLDSADSETPVHDRQSSAVPEAISNPWRPFRNLADFQYAEIAVNSHKTNWAIDEELKGIHGGWASDTVISFKTHKDLEVSLAAARHFVVGFQKGEVTSTFKGQDYTFSFYYRNPWDEILARVRDASLRLYDETSTGDTWWEIQNKLPQDSGRPHCFLPLHVWSDGGRASSTVTKHPMIMRPLWLPHEIRNGSGNGGGVLLTYMPSIPDPSNTSERTPLENTAFGDFKADIYHKVYKTVFAPLEERSYTGDTVPCGDEISRVLYPGIEILSLDHEEACEACGTRAPTATYPCPRCLLRNCDQHDLTCEMEMRTTRSMQSVYLEAKAAPSRTAREAILQGYGLHFVENAFWSIANSDPYSALSYDTLHSDDIGKWGKHLWPLLLDILSKAKKSEVLSNHMSLVPNWPGLSHFSCVTDIEYADGNKHFDILRCILPCIVGILPRGDPLIHCIRAYSRFRMYASLQCMSDGRIVSLRKAMLVYGSFCQKVGKEHGKNWDFPKQHASAHLPSDIRNKGATINYSTRPGEGFQREMKEAYRTTNFKNTDAQMTQVDANMEAVARIRLLVDEHDRKHNADDSSLTASEHKSRSVPRPNEHWLFRAPQARTTDSKLGSLKDPLHRFHHFPSSLQQFLKTLEEGKELLSGSNEIEILPYNCLDLKFQSLDDWKEGRNILRCNPDFYGHPRFDCVVINTEREASYARLQYMFTCKLPSHTELDICLLVSASLASQARPHRCTFPMASDSSSKTPQRQCQPVAHFPAICVPAGKLDMLDITATEDPARRLDLATSNARTIENEVHPQQPPPFGDELRDSPSHNIPVELLQMIFRLSLPLKKSLHVVEPHRQHAPLNVSAVCRYWRAVAMDTPELWYKFKLCGWKIAGNAGALPYRMEEAERWLRLSRTLPFQLAAHAAVPYSACRLPIWHSAVPCVSSNPTAFSAIVRGHEPDSAWCPEFDSHDRASSQAGGPQRQTTVVYRGATSTNFASVAMWPPSHHTVVLS
ncbi:hypothetical protein EVG20_g6237 [Dentipellis fragilis]|uniref:F-box domain-containing protein n=1 Tax=Dentipellis fragilis TaxID=205917 RepID=A0A4Y9YPI4_9AGAM|nr:hypothetical protein EVG20_g6237 [Dentipellis fragilis]